MQQYSKERKKRSSTDHQKKKARILYTRYEKREVRIASTYHGRKNPMKNKKSILTQTSENGLEHPNFLETVQIKWE